VARHKDGIRALWRAVETRERYVTVGAVVGRRRWPTDAVEPTGLVRNTGQRVGLGIRIIQFAVTSGVVKPLEALHQRDIARFVVGRKRLLEDFVVRGDDADLAVRF